MYYIILVLILAWPLKGNGIALALTVASSVNTIFLFVFMKKLQAMDVKKIIKKMILFILKMIAFSIIATIPVYYLRPILLNAFAGHHRFISIGIPVILTALIFAIVGVLLLILFKDETTISISKKVKTKIKK